jgi:threonine dehydrogenase-like Zn-dependent dehydrogenase
MLENSGNTTYDNFPIGQFFDKGISIKGGQAPVHRYIDELIAFVNEGKIRLDDIITHRLPLSQVEHGYEIFKKKEDNCVKVVMNPWE